MTDRFGRIIDYLRISVTDRCNLRCRYCMPPEGLKPRRRTQILSYEEIAEVARTAAGMGVTKLRITGGEPLVRRDCDVLVRMLAGIPGITDLAMSTNGTLLARHAQALARAGLGRVNISLDAVDRSRYAEITRGGNVQDVLAGIDAALEAGLTPVKLNCVVSKSSSEPDARDVADYGRKSGIEVRFIHRMNLATGEFTVVEGGSGGDCPRCNRLRLASDGRVRPCLFSDLSFSIRRLGVREGLKQAVRHKPWAGSRAIVDPMYAIGG